MVKRASNGNGPKDRLEDDIDALFMLPLPEFTPARNALATQLKKQGRQDDADRVKLLSKPSISAWTVNQLYWDHREAFDDLIATGRRFQPARSGANAAGMRDSLDARREALTNLSDIAEQVLTDAGHNASLETMRRVVANLEALSAYALLPSGPTPGRLTNDVDPPSFESLALLLSGGIPAREEPVAPARKSTAPPPARPKPATAGQVRKLEEFRRAKIDSAKAALQDAKKSLTDARSTVQSLEAKLKKANGEVREAEKHKRSAESLLEKATFAYESAAERAQSVEAEIKEATQEVEDAKRTVDEATQALESLLR